MFKENLNLSIETLIEVSSMLGQQLEDFSPVRQRQDKDFVKNIQFKTSTELLKPEQKKHFFISALDFMLYKKNNQQKFFFTEINGSGFTGVSNVSDFAINTVLNELEEIPNYISDQVPVILVACSGTREIKSSGRPSMMHEKILFAQAVKQGFQKHYGAGKIVTLYDIINQEKFSPEVPTVVFGYLMDFMRYITCIDGKLHLLGFPVTGATHDRFCDNIANAYRDEIDINQFFSVNNLFYITSDKGNAYSFYNDFIQEYKSDYFSEKTNFQRVFSRDELVEVIIAKRNNNQKVVIKPHGAALGRGIEFFVSQESHDDIIKKIDSSLEAVNRYCGVEGWAFPYTVVDFIDCCTIPDETYPLFGHKFEIRVLVYRDEDTINAFPSIVKISSKYYEKTLTDRLMLLNNVAAATGKTKIESSHYMLPLSNLETLKVIGITEDALNELCSFTTNFVKYSINRVDTKPIPIQDYYCPFSSLQDIK